MESVGSTSIAHKGNGWCTLIEASEIGDSKPPFWIQLHAGMFNFQYLDEKEPLTVLPDDGVRLPDGCKLTAWEPKVYCTFDVESVNEDDIEQMVRAALESYYGLAPNCKIKVTTEKLA
ncbi:hypothetical protein [Prosthecobacter sp.]|uniref:hypothetical protein n=1 Tax=Prosthecobacter sp. TaxID=1965333 RepID=UPI001D3F8AC1|nr:hypothetical protein [Prosthecobacter sp.]MCB1279870.1 hypothetical protein [Prosthecobacter sp.]